MTLLVESSDVLPLVDVEVADGGDRDRGRFPGGRPGQESARGASQRDGDDRRG